MTDDATDERQVLRSIWAAEGQRLDVDEERQPDEGVPEHEGRHLRRPGRAGQ